MSDEITRLAGHSSVERLRAAAMGCGAKVIADSISPEGHRLTTLEVTMHRFVLAEFNTHRAFSRNSASSRAIPLRRTIEKIHHDDPYPVLWAREQPGMQGGDEVDDVGAAYAVWESARDEAVAHAMALAEMGVHKSICNRLLEPFMLHTVIVSATDWEGFFDQRCSPLAQPEMRVAAEAMRDAYFAAIPTGVDWDGWHLPYTTEQERDEYPILMLRRLSVARCARVSYLTHDGKRDVSEDLRLFDRLVSAEPMHASPLEHVATPAMSSTPGNFAGWLQFRHIVETPQAYSKVVLW